MNVFASPVAAAGRIYIPSREGSIAVVESGEEFRLIAVNELEDGFDASPAVVDDEIYLRGRRYLYRISAEPSASAQPRSRRSGERPNEE